MNKQDLIAAGVRNLQEFGYPHCNSDNILTDMVYSQFFRAQLLDVRDLRPSAAPIANELIDEIDAVAERQEP